MRNSLFFPIFLLLIISLLGSGGLVAQEMAFVSNPLNEKSGNIQTGPQQKTDLAEVLKTLQKVYDIFFTYSDKLVKDKQVVFSMDTSENLDKTLEGILRPVGLQHRKVRGNTYVITPRSPSENPREQKENERREALQMTTRRSTTFPLKPLTKPRLSYVRPFQFPVSGKVTDAAGQPLIGVNILVKGSARGTVTDLEGNFSLDLSSGEETLVFSYTGYEPQEVAVNGRSVLNVTMSESISQLQEIVVTAFGIEKEKKALSYAVQEVEGQKLSAVGNTSIINSLQGKAAGVIVKQTSGAPGSRSRINIRGSRSFTGNNEPLYVIDGMPVASGSRAIDINPSDIKSVNILKGPTAAALYGLRASNGVILIETNKGEGAVGGQPRVSFETNYNFDRISMFPETQMTYAQGTGEQFDPFSAFSWGPRIDEMGTYTNQLGEQEVAAAYDNDAELFRTGGTLNSNLTIANAFEKGNYAINLGFTDQTGILKNSGMQRMNAKFAGGYDLSDKLRVNTSFNYTNNTVDMVTPPWWATFSIPPSYDLKGKPTHVPGNPYKQINFRGQHDNFYWALENNSLVDKTSRTFGNINFDYRPWQWLSVNYRLGLDEYTTNTDRVDELGSNATSGRTDPPSGGRVTNSLSSFRQVNSNLNITLNKYIGQHFNIELMAGNEFYDIRTNSLSNVGNDIVIGGFHHISNTSVQTTTENLSRRRVVGFFGNLSMSWKSIFYLNATGRNDIVSNMPSANRSFFYPSVGASVVFTELFSIPEEVLTFGKLRASVAEVGQAGPAHAVETVFRAGVADGGFTWPYQGLSAFTQSSTINSSDLRPENTRTVEFGFDLRFLNNRIGLDYTYYDSKAEGQIYSVPIANSTGFSSELRNAGEMSIRGHEIMLNIKPIETRDILWDFTANFTSFTNKVISLAEGIEQLSLGGFLVQSIAREGEEYPSLFGTGYARDPATGQVVVDGRPTLPNGNANPSYGMPLRSTESIILGSAQPDFEMTFLNGFSYKNLTLSIQVDWRQGGKLSSGYTRLGRLYGVLSETENRYDDYIFPGVKGAYDDAGNLVVEGPNDIVIQQGFQFYRRNQDPIRESNIFDATFVRLRELKLSYELPRSLLANSFIRSASVYLMGRNLWLDAALDHFDPEMFNQSEVESYNSYPQTKSFGGGIRVDF